MTTRFIGRKNELKKLNDLWRRSSSSLVVIKGRRRIGKSRLATEFAVGKKFISITGLTPDAGTTAQNQLDAFANQLAMQFGFPTLYFRDWLDALNMLSKQLTDAPTVILFDEISWMGALDPTFIAKLKIWWDMDIQKRSNVILIFCGSVSTWIEENILKSTSFFGRISMILELSPLNIQSSAELLRQIGFKGSAHDFYKILSVTGGIPWYLEQVLPQYSADQNIQRLCFEPDGLLVSEFNNIFHDLFGQKGKVYRDILETLNVKMDTLEGIRATINYPRSGTLSHLLSHLITAGFITQHPQWSIKTGKVKRQSLYRICDPYIRFYLKVIQSQKATQKPGYDSIMGYQVEALLLQNRKDLLDAIEIDARDIVYDNPYVQKQSTREKGCQIDYLIQTRISTLYVCEFKFRKNELKMDIVHEVEEKIQRLSRPAGFAVIPVLFHMGGVSEEVEDSGFFYRIIDMKNFL